MRLAAILLLMAAATAYIPTPRALVESIYSDGVFPLIQRVLTSISNRVPFALLDLAAGAAAVWWLTPLVRAVAGRQRAGWPRTLAGGVARTLGFAAAAYLVFLVTWGFNYRRVPLKERLDFDRTRVSADALLALSHESVARLNALYGPSRSAGWAAPGVVDAALARAFAQAQRELGATALAVPARPKWTILDAYFVRAAVAGMTDPFFLETLVASDLLPFERPFVVAHEWSHLAGRADEGDANLLGWLTCLRGNDAHQYSGWLFLYGEVLDALEGGDRPAVMATVEEGPRADLEAIRARFVRHVNPVVQQAGWRTYDQYLKANRVTQGTGSYGEVVRLILGTRFSNNWRPALR